MSLPLDLENGESAEEEEMKEKDKEDADGNALLRGC